MQFNFITPAHADAAAPSAGGFDLMGLIPFLLIFVVMYFFLIRPQQKKAKEHQELLKQLQKGDRIVTSGGFMAKIDKLVDENEVIVELADGVKVHMLRSAISQTMSGSSATKPNKKDEGPVKKASKLK